MNYKLASNTTIHPLYIYLVYDVIGAYSTIVIVYFW